MFSYTEMRGESDFDRRQRGSVEFQGEYVARRKPAWLVLGKLITIAGVIGLGLAVALRHVPYPPLQLTALYLGGILIYCGLAYFIRPRPNDMNMGWCGGLLNDPTQISDNVNRGLRDLEFFLQPGQIATEAVLDLFILLGCHRSYQPEKSSPLGMPPGATELPPPTSSTTGVLAPDRFER